VSFGDAATPMKPVFVVDADGQDGRHPNHEENAGMTSVPMSSIVCITDSWEIL
jgi:hypothetical protein